MANKRSTNENEGESSEARFAEAKEAFRRKIPPLATPLGVAETAPSLSGKATINELLDAAPGVDRVAGAAEFVPLGIEEGWDLLREAGARILRDVNEPLRDHVRRDIADLLHRSVKYALRREDEVRRLREQLLRFGHVPCIDKPDSEVGP